MSHQRESGDYLYGTVTFHVKHHRKTAPVSVTTTLMLIAARATDFIMLGVPKYEPDMEPDIQTIKTHQAGEKEESGQ